MAASADGTGVLHCDKERWMMGGNTISRGNVRIFSKNRTDVQLFCGNSAELIFGCRTESVWRTDFDI